MLRSEINTIKSSYAQYLIELFTFMVSFLLIANDWTKNWKTDVNRRVITGPDAASSFL